MILVIVQILKPHVLSIIGLGIGIWQHAWGNRPGDSSPGGTSNVITNAAGDGGLRNAANNGYITSAGG